MHIKHSPSPASCAVAVRWTSIPKRLLKRPMHEPSGPLTHTVPRAGSAQISCVGSVSIVDSFWQCGHRISPVVLIPHCLVSTKLLTRAGRGSCVLRVGCRSAWMREVRPAGRQSTCIVRPGSRSRPLRPCSHRRRAPLQISKSAHQPEPARDRASACSLGSAFVSMSSKARFSAR